MDGWNTSFLFGMAYFQGRTVSFGEGNVQFTHLKRTSAPQLGFIFSSFCPMNMNVKHHSSLTFLSCVRGWPLMSNICPPWGFWCPTKSGIIHLWSTEILHRLTIRYFLVILFHPQHPPSKDPNGFHKPTIANPWRPILKELPWKHHI